MNITKISDKIRFFEELGLNGHVALNTFFYDGWVLKFSNGYTGRANSVSLLYPSTKPLEEKVVYCEECYKKQGLPANFKITEIDSELSGFLKNRGYEVITPTDLMILDLQNTDFSEEIKDCECIFTTEPDNWLPYYFTFEEITDKAKQDTFRKMLSKVLVEPVYCSVMHEGKVVACASAAIEHGYALIQNVIVNSQSRGIGIGEKLCRGLLAKIKELGAEHAYLQVVQTNEVANNLYAKLGFKKVYSYWYMMKENSKRKFRAGFSTTTSTHQWQQKPSKCKDLN